MDVVQLLDALFEPDRNQQSDRDGRDVNEEVFPRMNRGVRRVNI
jgi:hypothetical protein